MRIKTKQERINDCLRYVKSPFKLVRNYVKPHIQNSDRHEMAKFLKCLQLMRDGKEIYTEVTFKDKKGRCDIFVPEDFRVIEILETETEEEALSKLDYYPEELEICFIRANEILKN